MRFRKSIKNQLTNSTVDRLEARLSSKIDKEIGDELFEVIDVILYNQLDDLIEMPLNDELENELMYGELMQHV